MHGVWQYFLRRLRVVAKVSFLRTRNSVIVCFEEQSSPLTLTFQEFRLPSVWNFSRQLHLFKLFIATGSKWNLLTICRHQSKTELIGTFSFPLKVQPDQNRCTNSATSGVTDLLPSITRKKLYFFEIRFEEDKTLTKITVTDYYFLESSILDGFFRIWTQNCSDTVASWTSSGLCMRNTLPVHR